MTLVLALTLAKILALGKTKSIYCVRVAWPLHLPLPTTGHLDISHILISSSIHVFIVVVGLVFLQQEIKISEVGKCVYLEALS